MDAVKFIEERNRMCGTMSEVWGVDAQLRCPGGARAVGIHPANA